MFNKRSNFPFAILSLPVFFILHVCNDYTGLLDNKIILLFLLYYFLLSIALLGTGYLLYRSVHKAGIWTTFLLIIFYFFGYLHDLLKSSSLTHILARYTVILPLTVIAVTLLSLYIKRKKAFYKLNYYFSVVFTLMAVIESGILLFHVFNRNKTLNDLSALNSQIRINAINHSQTKDPDIFFIVFDEYASSSSLQLHHHINNTGIDSTLEDHGFYVARKSQGNYNATPLSIGSALNLQYFPVPLELKAATARFQFQEWLTFEHSQVPEILADKGYKIINLGIRDFDRYPARNEDFFKEDKAKPLYLETFAGRIMKDISWNIFRTPFFADRLKKENERKRKQFVNNNNWLLTQLQTELGRQDIIPKFVFAHLMMPHFPFYINRDGKYQEQSIFEASMQYNRDKYAEQLLYVNKWINAISNLSGNPFSRPRVVVIEGDHGLRNADTAMPRESHFMNLSSYYFSDHDYSSLYQKISPVNSFRVIFNKYFGMKLPMLKDSTVLLK